MTDHVKKPKPFSYKTAVKIWNDYINFYKELAELFDCEMADRVSALDDQGYSLEEAGRCKKKRIERYGTLKQRQLRNAVLQTLTIVGVSLAEFKVCDEALQKLASPMFGNKGEVFVKKYGMTINTDDELTYRLKRQLDHFIDLRITYIDSKLVHSVVRKPVNSKGQKSVTPTAPNPETPTVPKPVTPKTSKSKGGRPRINITQQNLYHIVLEECKKNISQTAVLKALKENHDFADLCQSQNKVINKNLVDAAKRWQRSELRRNLPSATILKRS